MIPIICSGKRNEKQGGKPLESHDMDYPRLSRVLFCLESYYGFVQSYQMSIKTRIRLSYKLRVRIDAIREYLCLDIEKPKKESFNSIKDKLLRRK